MPRDAREAADVFLKQGQGDVLINYENEAILAQQKGAKFEYIVPDVNISIDNPIAIVDKNVDKHGNRAVVEAFVRYLFTPAAQAEFIKRGFRPSDLTQATPYPAVQHLNTVKNLGGWPALQRKFFADGAIFDQIQSQ
jgi:sulfate transport system substrate-binding protein